MKTPRIILGIIGGLTGLALIIIGYFTINSMNEASESAENLEKVKNDYARIFKTANPFPNEENKEILAKNNEKLAKWEKELLQIVKEGEYAPESKNFIREREEMIKRLTDNAPIGTDGKSVAVEGLMFGFDKYSNGEPVSSQDDVPRLMKQLVLIESFVQILYDAKIDQLKAVRREEFEDKSAENGNSSKRSSRSSRNRSSNAPINSGGNVEVEPFDQGVVPVERERFEFVFDARQDSLLTILNSIGAMKPFAMVSELSFEKSKDDYIPPVEEKKESKRSRRRSRNIEEVEEQTEQIIVNVRPPSRTSRLVSGELHEAPVTVTMAVDVFTFDPQEDTSDENTDDENDSNSEDTEEMNEGF